MFLITTVLQLSGLKLDLAQKRPPINFGAQVNVNIGIKHGFLCINICWAPREMLKPKPERRGFQSLLRGSAAVNVSEKHV